VLEALARTAPSLTHDDVEDLTQQVLERVRQKLKTGAEIQDPILLLRFGEGMSSDEVAEGVWVTRVPPS